MNDDWRVTLPYDGEGVIGELLENVRAGKLEHEAAKRLGDRVVFSHDDGVIFLYAATEADARTAEEVVRVLLERFKLRAEAGTLERWHPEEERWEDAAVPLPETDAERAAEHARLMESEREDSRETGVPEWEVQVTLADSGAARAYAHRLEQAGLSVVRRDRYVMAGAETEDDAVALADRLRAEAPEGARFDVEGNGRPWWSALNRFAVFGGLGG
jgi:hypothetical protein